MRILFLTCQLIKRLTSAGHPIVALRVRRFVFSISALYSDRQDSLCFHIFAGTVM